MKTFEQDKNLPLKQIKTKQVSSLKKQQQKLYFQHQNVNLLCGMHALNNFLGKPKYNVDSMNQICYVLASGKKVLNPHKHWIMQGDYDVNVLMYALQECGYTTKWHDKRKQLQNYNLKQIQGFLVNIEVKNDTWFKWSGLCCASGRHWITVKKVNNNKNNLTSYLFAVLDSSKQTYEIKPQQQLLNYLNKIQKQTAQIIGIYKQTIKLS